MATAPGSERDGPAEEHEKTIQPSLGKPAVCPTSESTSSVTHVSNTPAVTSNNFKDNYSVLNSPHSDTEPNDTKAVTTSVSTVVSSSACGFSFSGRRPLTENEKNLAGSAGYKMSTCSRLAEQPNTSETAVDTARSQFQRNSDSLVNESGRDSCTNSFQESAESIDYEHTASFQFQSSNLQQSTSTKTATKATVEESSLSWQETGASGIPVSESGVCESGVYANSLQHLPAEVEGAAGSTDYAVSVSDNPQRASHSQQSVSILGDSTHFPAIQEECYRLRNNSVARPARYIPPLARELGLQVLDDDGAVDLREARRALQWNSKCLSCRELTKEVCVLPCGHWILCRRCFLDPHLDFFQKCYLCGGHKEAVKFSGGLLQFLLDRS